MKRVTVKLAKEELSRLIYASMRDAEFHLSALGSYIQNLDMDPDGRVEMMKKHQAGLDESLRRARHLARLVEALNDRAV